MNISAHSFETSLPVPLEYMSPVKRIIFIIFMTSMAIFGTIFNFLVIIVYRKKFNKNSSLFLLFTLSVIDFLASLFVIPTTLLEYFQYFHNINVFCKISYFSRYTTTAISVALLGLVAFERYYTITSQKVNSMRKTQMNLVKQSRVAVIVTLFVCTLYGSVCFFLSGTECDTVEHALEDDEHNELHRIYNYTTVSILMLILACIIFLYVRTYIVVKRCSNKVFSCNTKVAGDYTKTNAKNMNRDAKKNDEQSCFECNNKVLVSTIGNLISIQNNNSLNKTNFQKRKKVSFNTKPHISLNIYDHKVGNTSLHNKKELPIICGANEECESSITNLDHQFNVFMASIKENNVDSVANREFYSNFFISKENPKINKIRVVPVDEENENKQNDCRIITFNKIVTNNSIRKDWKVAKIFALVSFILHLLII